MSRHAVHALVASLLCLSLIPASAADTPTAAQETKPAALLLRAAHLFDGKTGKLVSPGAVRVEGQRITAIGAAASAEGATLIDLGDATLLPGYIDAHTHLTYDYEEDWSKAFYEGMLRTLAEQTLHTAYNAKITLRAGVTTVRNVGSNDFIDIGLRNAIEQGLAEGPRILAAGYSIGSTGGHCDGSPIPPDRVALNGPLQGICDGPEECRRAVRLQMKFGADVIKICASGGVLSESDPVDVPQLTPDELRAIIGEAHTWGRKVAAHSHGDLAARQAVEAGVDSIEHGSFLSDETLKLMKAKGTYLVPTRITVTWLDKLMDHFPPKIRAKAQAAQAAHADAMKRALAIGVPIAMGTDSSVYPQGLNAREFGDYVDLGMTPAQALLTSSQGAARLLGIESETGTLETGKFADIVAVPGNVLENIHATETPLLVMKQGKVVEK